MPLIGVDSAAFVTEPFWAATAKALGKPPAFWGRYLHQFPVSRQEIDLLHGHGCAVLLVWNGDGPLTVIEGAGVGEAHGRDAADAAKALGAPAGTAVMLDCERSWNPRGPFLRAWALAVEAGGYTPGFYYSPLSSFTPHFAALAHADATLAARCLLWAADWRGTPPEPPADWPPTIGSHPLTGWQFGGDWNGVDVDAWAPDGARLWKPVAKEGA